VTVSVLLGVALAAWLVLLPKPEIGLIMEAV
jgi:long-chain acyl-CoA synthetase